MRSKSPQTRRLGLSQDTDAQQFQPALHALHVDAEIALAVARAAVDGDRRVARIQRLDRDVDRVRKIEQGRSLHQHVTQRRIVLADQNGMAELRAQAEAKRVATVDRRTKLELEVWEFREGVEKLKNNCCCSR